MTVPTRTVADFGPTAERHLWKRVARTSDGSCWEWLGRKTAGGYGEFTYGSKSGQTRHIRAHRAVYELIVGSIPAGHPLDHLCENRTCVNPDHLAPVTPRENAHHVLTRKSGGRDIRIPDPVWNAAEAVALGDGLDLSDVVTAFLEEYGAGPLTLPFAK